MSPSRGLAVTLLAAFALACKPSGPGDELAPRKLEPASKEDGAETGADADAPKGQPLRAAGVELTIPADWVVLVEDEANFALAHKPEDRPTHIPVCSIELRRQGPGPLPEGARERGEDLEYKRGALRGRFRLLPGPGRSTIVVHCRAPRSSRQWTAVGEIFASLRKTGETVELPPARSEPRPTDIVELCTGTPARMTQVCARRADGAVYCGVTTGEALSRVALAGPAAQISCAGTRACARDQAGALSCWGMDNQPEPVAEGVRDMAGACFIDGGGALRCREGELETFVELAPLGDRALALSEVERVLEGSDQAAGCVLREGGLWCWEREQAPGEEAGVEGGPRLIADAAGATDLRRLGERVCVEQGGRWGCIDPAAGERFELELCEARPCGCSAIGATRLSCEHEPYVRLDSRPLGRITGVVAVSEPCAARTDGTVVCRGPAAGQTGDDPRTTAAIAGGLPGIAHVLELRDAQK